MQISRFANGGFVLHRVEGRYSCWYDTNGDMLDCEATRYKVYPHHVYRSQRSMRVKRDGPTWQRLAKLGPIWRNNDTTKPK